MRFYDHTLYTLFERNTKTFINCSQCLLNTQINYNYISQYWSVSLITVILCQPIYSNNLLIDIVYMLSNIELCMLLILSIGLGVVTSQQLYIVELYFALVSTSM